MLCYFRPHAVRVVNKTRWRLIVGVFALLLVFILTLGCLFVYIGFVYIFPSLSNQAKNLKINMSSTCFTVQYVKLAAKRAVIGMVYATKEIANNWESNLILVRGVKNKNKKTLKLWKKLFCGR